MEDHVDIEMEDHTDDKKIEMEDHSDTAEDSSVEVPTKENEEIVLKKEPNFLQVWFFGCCRSDVREKTALCCGDTWFYIGCTIVVLALIALLLFLFPWVTGNIVVGASSRSYSSSNGYVKESCWILNGNDNGMECLKSFGIGLGVFIFMIVPFIAIIVLGIIFLRNPDKYYYQTSNTVYGNSLSPTYEPLLVGLIWCIVIFWIAFPPFIGAVGGFRLAMNHFPNCQYWQNDFQNNIEYACSTPNEMIITAQSNGFCSIGAYICQEGAPCSAEENELINIFKCSQKLKAQCSHCKGIGWAAIGLSVWFLPLVILILYWIGKGIYYGFKMLYNLYQTWKKDLTNIINTPAPPAPVDPQEQPKDPSTADYDLEASFNSTSSQMNTDTCKKILIDTL
jgi:hypothetical protein